ncbi:MAG: hypothetical protein HY908_22945 [Myxococcales bacterium]|nr:hypothetical protein [Myxococcales bacterium]
MAVEAGLALLGSVLTARLLMPEGRGQLQRWVYWTGVITGVAGFGMITALPQLVGARRLSLDDARRMFTLLAVTLAPAAVLLGMLLLTGTACPGEGSDAGWYWMLALAVPGGVVGALGYGMLVAAGRVRALMVTRVAGTGLRVLGLGLLMVLLVRSVLFASVVIGVTSAAAGVALTVLVRPRIPRRDALQPLWPLLARGAAIHASTLVAIALTVVNQGWAYARLSDEDSGLFGVAAGAAATLQVISLAELTASTVAMSDTALGWGAVRRALRRSSMLSALGAVVAVAVAPFAVPLVFGTAFAGAVWPFCLLVAATAGENISKVSQAALQSRGYPKVAWVVDGARATSLVACMATFGIANGVVGVSLATAIAQGVAVVAGLAALVVARYRLAPAPPPASILHDDPREPCAEGGSDPLPARGEPPCA